MYINMGEVIKEYAAQSYFIEHMKNPNKTCYDPSIFIIALNILANKNYEREDLELLYYFDKLSKKLEYGYGSFNLFIKDLRKAHFKTRYISKNNGFLFKRLKYLKNRKLISEFHVPLNQKQILDAIEMKKIAIGKCGIRRLFKVNNDKIMQEFDSDPTMFMTIISDLIIQDLRFKHAYKFFMAQKKLTNKIKNERF